MNLIEMTKVRKRFGEKAVLTNMTMQVAAGETVGFVGPNGAGKTTCLRILLGLLARDSGQAQVLGLDPSRAAVQIREHCSYLPGETSIYHGMRGNEFLRFALSFYPHHQDDIRRSLLDAFELPLQKKVRSYSAGMKQKLALMATLIPDVDLYILDEPDRALDATTRFFLRDIIRKLHQGQKTILLSSHHLSEVETLANRLVFLMHGEVISAQRVADARQTLERRVRLKVLAGTNLPEGAQEVRCDLDGTFHMEPDGDPIAWLAKLHPSTLVSAEVGGARLEDLYQILTEGEQV